MESSEKARTEGRESPISDPAKQRVQRVQREKRDRERAHEREESEDQDREQECKGDDCVAVERWTALARALATNALCLGVRQHLQAFGPEATVAYLSALLRDAHGIDLGELLSKRAEQEALRDACHLAPKESELVAPRDPVAPKRPIARAGGGEERGQSRNLKRRGCREESAG